MPRRLIDRIREKIRLREYDMTVHAMEEMAEDDLDILDIEEAVLNGRVVRSNKHDPRGEIHGRRFYLGRRKASRHRGKIPRNDAFLDYYGI